MKREGARRTDLLVELTRRYQEWRLKTPSKSPGVPEKEEDSEETGDEEEGWVFDTLRIEPTMVRRLVPRL